MWPVRILANVSPSILASPISSPLASSIILITYENAGYFPPVSRVMAILATNVCSSFSAMLRSCFFSVLRTVAQDLLCLVRQVPFLGRGEGVPAARTDRVSDRRGVLLAVLAQSQLVEQFLIAPVAVCHA